jgi:hypothetical protein
MRLLVISDTHRSLANVYKVINDIYDMIDGIIHLGDVADDVALIKHRFPDLPVYNVLGNCDWGDTSAKEEAVLNIEGKRIFITHGHNYGVNSGIYRLSLRGREVKADCCLYGHTHVPLVEYDGDMVIMNPGSLSQPRGGSRYSYGMLIIDESGLRVSTLELR